MVRSVECGIADTAVAMGDDRVHAVHVGCFKHVDEVTEAETAGAAVEAAVGDDEDLRRAFLKDRPELFESAGNEFEIEFEVGHLDAPVSD